MNWIKKTKNGILGISGILILALIFGVFMFLMNRPAPAANLSADLNVPMKDGIVQAYPVAGSTIIYKGSLVSVNSSGYAIPAKDTASTIVLGIADEKIDNSAGSNGVKKINVISGKAFKLKNSGLGQSNVGGLCYISDDQTVANTSNNLIVAGVVTEYVSSSYVWVFMPSPNWRTSLSAVYGVASITNVYDGNTSAAHGISGDTVRLGLIAPKAGTIIQAVLYCKVCPAAAGTATIGADVLIGTTTIYSTKPAIAKTATCPDDTYASGTGITVGVISTSADDFVAGDRLTVKYDITEGSTVTNHAAQCAISVFYKTLVQ